MLNLTELGFKESDIKEHPKKIVYEKVANIICTSQYIHLKNNSIINLINNFSNIYKCRESIKNLEIFYQHKLDKFEHN